MLIMSYAILYKFAEIEDDAEGVREKRYVPLA